jgi:pilus assembly protein CpaB
VPVRLSDPDVADLLRPGDEVDVLVLGRGAGDVRVLAAGAVVLAVQPAAERRSGDGRLVVLGVGADQAAAVATASLETAVTVTFR